MYDRKNTLDEEPAFVKWRLCFRWLKTVSSTFTLIFENLRWL